MPMTERSAPRPVDRSRQRPAQRGRQADGPRRAAYTLLRAVDGGAYANLELPKLLREQHLSGRDAAFATELAYGTLRLRGRYDPIIAIAAGRELSSLDAPVLDTLRLGAHQLLGMRVPAHAATAETVALARQVNGIGAAGLVNAVLRRIGERSLPEWLELIVPSGVSATTAMAIRESHPEWIVKALADALRHHPDPDPAAHPDLQLQRLLEADNHAPLVALAARPGLASVAELISAGAQPGRWAATAAIWPAGDPGALAAVRDGRAAVQDEGSQLVALALAAVTVDPPRPSTPERWLDLCAGPGGKAGLLAGLALTRGATLLANEISEHRARLVEQTLGPALAKAAAAGDPEAIQVQVGDGREVGTLEPAAYDRVLLDAPCTGLGALRRRPEARWRRSLADLSVLSKLQRELLGSALDATRPGGVVGYATCSPHLVETVFAVQDVLRKRTDAVLLDAPEWLPDNGTGLKRTLPPGPWVQLWPHRHDTDGMFLALIRRTSGQG